MEARELRIGNYIKRGSGIAQIEWFDLRNIQERNNNHNYEAEARAIEPIQLTQMWFMDLGLNPSHNLGSRRFYNIGTFTVELCGNNETACYYTSKGELICFIYYVHQLQNLFYSLTSKELTLKK